MSKYPCDNWSWSSRRCDPKLRDRAANKENEPISPLSRLADRVDDSRRWAPIPDRWHNHCEWLVNHHRKLGKRFRKTTADDRLSGVLTTLKCTRERRRGSSEEDGSVIGSETRCKRSRSQVEYPELRPASTWLGTVHPELFQHKLLSPLEAEPFTERDDEMKVESKTGDAANQAAHSNPSFESIESISERAKISEGTVNTQSQGVSRSPSPVDGTFEPESFRTSTPTANEKSRRDAEEPSTTFRRSSAWKDYVMSHDPILFRSYVDTQYPKKSWRHCHQKLAARHGGKYRRSSSGRIRKPPTPKSLRISWNSLDDVVQNEGILKSPLRLPPILPSEVIPPMDTEDDHGGDVERDDDLLADMTDNNNVQTDLRNVIGDGIRAIRKDCKARYSYANDSYAAGDERDVELGIDPSDLSDISFGEEREESTSKHGYELDEVSNDEDIDDICRIVDKELHHENYHPEDILTEISFDILDDLEVDSKYPPNYFQAGFADRAIRRRNIRKATRMIERLDPQARSFKPTCRVTPDLPEEDNADQRIVKFVDRKTPDQDRNEDQIPDVWGSGTKFYPSDVRFKNKDGLKKIDEPQKAQEHKPAEPKAVIPIPVPVAVAAPVKRVDLKLIQQRFVQECESKRKQAAEIKEDYCVGQQTSRKEVVSKAVETEPSVPKAGAEQVKHVGADKNEKTSSIIKPIAKGKAKRQVAHKISVVMGRRAWKPSHDFEKNSSEENSGHTGSWSPAAGDDDNDCVVPKRTPQLRRIEVHHGDANALDNDSVVPSRDANAVEKGQTTGTVNVITEAQDKVKAGVKVQKVPARTEDNAQSHSHQPETSMRNLDVSLSRQSAMMMQRLALLKESHGNSPVGEAGPVNSPDGGLKEQHDSQKMTKVGKGVFSNPSEQVPRDLLELGHRGVEMPDENNNRTVNDVPQAKKNYVPKIANAENNDEIEKGRGISENASGCKQNKLPCEKTHTVKEKQSESLVNVERIKPLASKQNEVRRSRATPLSEAGRDNHPPQPLIQNPPHQYLHPQHNMNPNVHPNMHPNMHPMQGNTPLYQHPPDQQPRGPFNPNLSAYHHHQMALRAAAMQYYSQQRHMVMQRHHPGFFHQQQQQQHHHQHAINMHPGYRPEWNNMPGPGPPR